MDTICISSATVCCLPSAYVGYFQALWHYTNSFLLLLLLLFPWIFGNMLQCDICFVLEQVKAIIAISY